MTSIGRPLYEAHFSLTGRPFGESSPFLPLPSREAMLRRLDYTLSEGSRAALLFGRPGTGKTRMVRELGRMPECRLIHLTFPVMPADELLAFLADELEAPGHSDHAPGMAASIRRVRQALARSAGRGERLILVVDEAHLIEDPATFEALRLLQNFATDGPPDLALLFVGGPEMMLNMPPGLEDRLAAHCRLDPLDEAESAAYVAGRLAAVGGPLSLFTAEALARLHIVSYGLPRRINRLADLALLLAFADGESQVGRHWIDAADRERNPPSLAA